MSKGSSQLTTGDNHELHNSLFRASILERVVATCEQLCLCIPSLQPEKAQRAEGGDTQGDTTLDRATAMEDCSRLALEAEQSLPIARTVGEALAVLSTTVSTRSSSVSPQVIAAVSSEVASAVIEAEELVDDLLRVIQVSCRSFFHDVRSKVQTIIICSSRYRPFAFTFSAVETCDFPE